MMNHEFEVENNKGQNNKSIVTDLSHLIGYS